MLCYRCGSYTPDDSRKCSECGQPIAEKRRQSRNLSGATAGRSAAIPPFEAGQIVARRYRIIGPAGAGSTGWVMRARDEEVDVEVGLKLIATNLLQTESERSKFLKAVKQVRKIHHANIARIYDEGRDERHIYYTMPLLEGLNLRKIIDLRLEKGETFSLAETLPLFTQLAQALDAMAKVGPHGALRPSNIMVLPDMLKLTAMPHLRGLPRRPFVALQSRVNTLEYLAPEARREDVAVDGRADVYSVAVIVGEMLSGKIRERDAKAWDEAQAALPREVAVALHRGLADAPPSRFDTPAQLVDALEKAAREHQAASPEPQPMPGEVSDSAPTAPEPMPTETETEATDHGRPVVDLGPAKRRTTTPETAPSNETPSSRSPSVATDPMSRELPLEGPPGYGVPRRGQSPRLRERRGGAHSGSWLLLAVTAILVAGVAVSAAIWWRHRPATPDSEPIQDTLAAAGGTTSASGVGNDSNETVGPARDRERSRAGPRPRDKARAKGKPRTRSKPEPSPKPEPRRTARAGRSPAALASVPPRDHGTRRPVGAPPSPPPPPAVVSLVAPEPASSRLEPKPESALEPAGKSCPAGMVSVEGGSFELGSSPSDDMRGFGELRAQQRRVKTFCIDIYEYPNQRGKAPRVGVSWTSARRACERAGKRLCTEAEWEKACKGPGGKRFPFGNRYSPDACNISEGSGADRKPGPCGGFPRCRSGYGVVDLAGNVREWTASQFQKGVSDRVVKGGAADDGAYVARCAARLNEAAGARQPNIGFRCCADPR